LANLCDGRGSRKRALPGELLARVLRTMQCLLILRADEAIFRMRRTLPILTFVAACFLLLLVWKSAAAHIVNRPLDHPWPPRQAPPPARLAPIDNWTGPTRDTTVWR
jgi:hypothetical protein